MLDDEQGNAFSPIHSCVMIRQVSEFAGPKNNLPLGYQLRLFNEIAMDIERTNITLPIFPKFCGRRGDIEVHLRPVVEIKVQMVRYLNA